MMGGLTLWEGQGLAFHQQCIPLQRLLRKKQLWLQQCKFSQHSLHHLERTRVGDPSDIVRLFETHSIVTTKGWNLLFLLCALPRSQELIYFLLWYRAFFAHIEECHKKPRERGNDQQTTCNFRPSSDCDFRRTLEFKKKKPLTKAVAC